MERPRQELALGQVRVRRPTHLAVSVNEGARQGLRRVLERWQGLDLGWRLRGSGKDGPAPVISASGASSMAIP